MHRRNQIALLVLCGLALLGAARLWLGRRVPPQLPASHEVFKTVDSLFTAVTARDPARLASCQERLHGYQQLGVLPPAAAKQLDRIMATARDGQWEPAARSLYDFMQGQRREGAVLPPLRRQTAMRVKRS